VSTSSLPASAFVVAASAVALIAAIVLVAYARVRRVVRRLAGQVVLLRRVTGQTLRYVETNAAPSADPALYAELDACGLVRLGERDEVDALASVRGPTRWFRDAEGAVFGFAAEIYPPNAAGIRPVLMMRSAVAGGHVAATRGAPPVRLAKVPGVRVEWLPASTPLRDMLASHRATVQALGGATRRVDSIDSVLAAHADARAAVQRWRADQPYDELLDADLSGILGDRFAALTPLLRRRVVAIERAAGAASAGGGAQ